MGYTHYWYKPKELDAEKFKLFASDVRKIVGLAEKGGAIKIMGGNGVGSPKITDEFIILNGDRKGNNDGETFSIDRIEKKELSRIDIIMGDEADDTGEKNIKGKYFKFCKTMMRPYDIVVVASLVALKYRFPEVILRCRNKKDVKYGVGLAEEVLGIKLDYKALFVNNKEGE